MKKIVLLSLVLACMCMGLSAQASISQGPSLLEAPTASDLAGITAAVQELKGAVDGVSVIVAVGSLALLAITAYFYLFIRLCDIPKAQTARDGRMNASPDRKQIPDSSQSAQHPVKTKGGRPRRVAPPELASGEPSRKRKPRAMKSIEPSPGMRA